LPEIFGPITILSAQGPPSRVNDNLVPAGVSGLAEDELASSLQTRLVFSTPLRPRGGAALLPEAADAVWRLCQREPYLFPYPQLLFRRLGRRAYAITGGAGRPFMGLIHPFLATTVTSRR
jgi:hypothetical protein